MRFLVLAGILAAAAAGQERVPGKGVNFYSIEKEIALGRQLAAEFRRNSHELDSPAIEAYIDGIGQRLAGLIGGPPFAYSFSLVSDDVTALHEVAAFPGGFLFVPAPLILAAKDEDELAGMLAHAIAHVAARDGTRMATRSELANLATIPLIYVGGWTGYAIEKAQSAAIPLGMVQMWRKLEIEADRLAAGKMAAAGYDPGALARYIDREQARYDEYASKMTSPLPRREQRVEAIEVVIGGLPAQVYPQHEGLERVQDQLRRITGRL